MNQYSGTQSLHSSAVLKPHILIVEVENLEPNTCDAIDKLA